MKKFVILLIVIGAGGAVAYALWYRGKNADSAENAEMQTARAERGPIRLTVASTGRVVSNLDVEIKCKASGQIMQLTIMWRYALIPM